MSRARAPTRSTLLIAVLAVAGSVTAACANSPETTVSGVEPPPVEPTVTPEPPTPEPTATTEPPTPVPTATPEPTAFAGFGCDVEPLPDDVTEVTEADVEVDGDDDPDVATAYHADADPSTGWGIRVTFGNGDVVDTVVGFGFPELTGVQPVGGADIDGDGRDEVFAIVGSGAASTIYGIFKVEPEACTIDPVVLEEGPLEAAAGASVGVIGGLRCDDTDGDGHHDTVALYSGLLLDSDPPAYDVTEQLWELDGPELTFVGSQSYVLEVDSHFRGGRLDCPPLFF